MILICEDQVKYAIKPMLEILSKYRTLDGVEIVDYCDATRIKKEPRFVAEDIAKLIKTKMQELLKNRGILASENNVFDKSEVLIRQPGRPQIDGKESRFALVMDLSASSSATTPDTSYGVIVVRELALLLKCNNERDQEKKVRRAMQDFLGDDRFLVIFHSKFPLDPIIISSHWYLNYGEIEVRPACDFKIWSHMDFDHSSKKPIIYSTYKEYHDGKILPKIVQWETNPL